MKPSPYFTDRFRYFFKRFYSSKALFRWFLEQAGEDSGAFDFPAALKNKPKTLVLLHRDMERASAFMHAMPQAFFENTLLYAHESLHAIVAAKRAKAIYYSDLECRYGENAFSDVEQKIRDFAPQVTLYMGDAFFPRLYLAKISGAPCRIGFVSENCYPFLNVSLHPDKSSEASLVANYYGLK